MELFTIVSKDKGELVIGSPKYPQWCSDEPDVYVAKLEYTREEYEKIRKQADCWELEVFDGEDDDHGYSQTYSKSSTGRVKISDERILVKDGSFYGITETMIRNMYAYKRIYVSIDTAESNHGLWRYHNGHSSDNSSGSEDTVLYLRPVGSAEDV